MTPLTFTLFYLLIILGAWLACSGASALLLNRRATRQADQDARNLMVKRKIQEWNP